MRKLRTISIAAGLASLCIFAALGCGGSESSTAPPAKPGKGTNTSSTGERRIVLLTNGNSPFWDAARAGLQEAAKDLKLKDAGLTAVLENSEPSAQGQLSKLRQFETQTDIAAIGISAIDAANQSITDQLRKFKDKGIHIVTVDSDVDREKMRDARFAFIGTDNLIGGRELGKCALYLRPQGGEYVTFVGRTGAQNAMERISGFADGAGPKFKTADSMGDLTDRSRARENVRNAIRNHPNLKVLVGIWSYNAPAITDVVKELGKRDAFTIIAFDAEPNAVDAMEEGLIDAMVVQNPYRMGYDGVKLMKALIEDDKKTIASMLPNQGKDGGDIIDTGLKVVVPDKGSPLKKEMFNPTTEFLKLSAFREWLNKYKLTGS